MQIPFRADQVGSLLRPQALSSARLEKKSDLKEIQERAIREVVAKQEAIGLQAVTDGEFSRDWWHLDDVAFAYLCDPKIRAACLKNGDDPERLPRTYAAAINRALEDRPAGMAITMHTCRGNFKSAWVAEGGYEPVAEAMFSAKVDGFFMEF